MMVKIAFCLISLFSLAFCIDDRRLFSDTDRKYLEQKPDSVKVNIIAKQEKLLTEEIEEFLKSKKFIDSIGIGDSLFRCFSNFHYLGDEYFKIKKSVNVNNATVEQLARANNLLVSIKDAILYYKVARYLKGKSIVSVSLDELESVNNTSKEKIFGKDTTLTSPAEIYYLFFYSIPILLQTVDTSFFYKKIAKIVPLKIAWKMEMADLDADTAIVRLLFECTPAENAIIYGYKDYYEKVTVSILSGITTEFDRLMLKENTQDFQELMDDFYHKYPREKLEMILMKINKYSNDSLRKNKLDMIIHCCPK